METVRDEVTPTPILESELPEALPNFAAIVDVETTGLNPTSDEILELAIALFDFDRSTGEVGPIRDGYVGLREPYNMSFIPLEAVLVHGINWDMVKGRTLDMVKIADLLDSAEEVIAHNAAFDRSFVSHLFPSEAKRWWLCTMTGIDWYGRGYTSRKLTNLAQAHGVSADGAHRALADVIMIHKLLSHSAGDRESYFAELLASGADRSRPVVNRLSKSQRRVIDKHFAYQYEIQRQYKNRDDPKALRAAITACEKQIAIAAEVAECMRAEFPTEPLPAHVGYEQLAIIREKQGEFADAIRLSRLALEQEWAGEWGKRLARCEKKLAKRPRSSAEA